MKKMREEQRSQFLFAVVVCLIFIALFVMMLPIWDVANYQNFYYGKVTELIVDKGDYAFIFFVPEGGEKEILFIKEPLKSLVLKNGIPREYTFELKRGFSFQEYSEYRRVVKIIE